jgi:hypothetical protein
LDAHSLFEQVGDLPRYVDVLHGFRTHGRVPLLGDATGAARRFVVDRTDAVPHRPDPDVAGSFVVTLRDSPAAPLAHALAAAVDGVCVEVDEIGRLVAALRAHGNPPYVVLVALAEEVDEQALMEVHDKTWALVEQGAFTGHLGVLTGATPADLAWLLTKGLAFPHRRPPDHGHTRVWPALDKVARRHGDGRWVTREEATAEQMEPLLAREHTGVASFIAHGRDDVLHLHDTVVCAAGPDRLENPDPHARLPVCAYTGRCFRSEIPPERILRSSDLRLDVVFTNACMSWRVGNGLFPHEYLLAHGFLRGAVVAYVGSPNLVTGVVKLNDLFHVACGSGASVGQAASMVNDHLRHERVDLPYFTVLGLPWVTPMAPTAGQADGLTVLDTGEQQAGGSLMAAARALATSEDQDETVHVVHVSGRTASVLDRPSVDATAATARDGLPGELRRLGSAIMCLEDVALLGFRHSRQGNLLVNLREQISSLAASLGHAVSVGDTSRIQRRVSSLDKSVRRSERSLADALFERGTVSFMNFDDLWGEVLERAPQKPTDLTCPYCARWLVRLDAVHPLFERIARSGLVCSRCCMVVDLDRRAPLRDLRLEGPEFWFRGDDVELTFTIEPDDRFTVPTTGTAGVHTEACERNRVGFPQPQDFVLEPGKPATVTVTATVEDDAHLHQEYLRGFVVVEGTVNYASKPVYVRPPNGTGAATAT